jgi:hypothetical protein
VGTHNQWWINAFTIDPTIILQDIKAVWMCCVHEPVAPTGLLIATASQLSCALVYMAERDKCCTRVWFPCAGGKHGGADDGHFQDDSADTIAHGQMYYSFHFWHAKLDDDSLCPLKSLQYLSNRHGLREFKEKASYAAKEKLA